MRYIFMLSLLLTVSCKYQGTDTGNPVPVNGSTTATYLIISTVCAKVESCQILADTDDCISQNLSSTDFGIKLGLPLAQQSWSLSKIDVEEDLGNIMPNLVNTKQCVVDLGALTCAEPVVQDAYDVSLLNPYEKVKDVLPASCATVF